MSAYNFGHGGIGAADEGGCMPGPVGDGCSPRARTAAEWGDDPRSRRRRHVEDVLLLVALIATLVVIADLGLRRAGW